MTTHLIFLFDGKSSLTGVYYLCCLILDGVCDLGQLYYFVSSADNMIAVLVYLLLELSMFQDLTP